MKLDKEISKVIADLEHCIGSECYNPNSYDGWNDVEGCSFRYPINVPIIKTDGQASFQKVRGNINTSYLIDAKDITPEAMSYMKYKFGSNELLIGKGIIKVLEYLENRYDIDFNQLEKERME